MHTKINYITVNYRLLLVIINLVQQPLTGLSKQAFPVFSAGYCSGVMS